jgi:hypothetical protein
MILLDWAGGALKKKCKVNLIFFYLGSFINRYPHYDDNSSL